MTVRDQLKENVLGVGSTGCDCRDPHRALCGRSHLACAVVAEDAGDLWPHIRFHTRGILSVGSRRVGGERKPQGRLTAPSSSPLTKAQNSTALRSFGSPHEAR